MFISSYFLLCSAEHGRKISPLSSYEEAFKYAPEDTTHIDPPSTMRSYLYNNKAFHLGSLLVTSWMSLDQSSAVDALNVFLRSLEIHFPPLVVDRSDMFLNVTEIICSSVHIGGMNVTGKVSRIDNNTMYLTIADMGDISMTCKGNVTYKRLILFQGSGFFEVTSTNGSGHLDVVSELSHTHSSASLIRSCDVAVDFTEVNIFGEIPVNIIGSLVLDLKYYLPSFIDTATCRELQVLLADHA